MSYTISGEFSFTNAFDPDSHGVCHGDELIYLFEPFYSHNGDPGLGPLSGDDLGKKLVLFFKLSDSQDSHILSPEWVVLFFRTQAHPLWVLSQMKAIITKLSALATAVLQYWNLVAYVMLGRIFLPWSLKPELSIEGDHWIPAIPGYCWYLTILLIA